MRRFLHRKSAAQSIQPDEQSPHLGQAANCPKIPDDEHHHEVIALTSSIVIKRSPSVVGPHDRPRQSQIFTRQSPQKGCPADNPSRIVSRAQAEEWFRFYF